jgi:electron transfer flavoprotein beta subunit
MKIVVAIKQVPVRDAQVRINPIGKWVKESGIHHALNDSEAFAQEESLLFKEKHGGEVIVHFG